ncbi:hypothetical protein L1049_013015 [Liquidambar formosana]|uniref:C3H1-type domain-containing protein n=1 Tax=Liquidambar formosana TaxID=63359 RepID=A0AAP0RJK3_LIQFO
MAASSDNGSSATETLNPSDEKPHPSIHPPMNGYDSTEPSPQTTPQEPAETKPCDIQSMVDTISGEKRKRDDPEAPENEEPKPSLHPLWKTSLCSYFRSKSGSCSHGDGCRYAHSEEELRPRPDSTWDPTSERAKKLMKSENGEKVELSDCKEDDVLMTEAFVDDDCSDPALSKCLVHLPRSWSSDNLRKFLSEQASNYVELYSVYMYGVTFKSAKKKKGMTVGFVSFESAEQVKSATEELDGVSVGKNNLKVADVITRSFEKKAKLAMPLSQSTQKSMKPALAGVDSEVSVSSDVSEDRDIVDDSSAMDGSASRGRSARDVVTPLAHMSYSDQLEHKKNSIAANSQKTYAKCT